MDPVPPWSAYASYNRLAGVQPGTPTGDIHHHHHLTTHGAGGVPTATTTAQLLPGGFLSPPPPVSYETVFPPLFHHATAKPAPHYVTQHRQVLAQAAVSKQTEGDYHQAQAFFDQNSAAWQQNSPFGILPHESVSTTKSYENFNAHFAALSNNHLNSLAAKNVTIRAQSPQVPVTFPTVTDVAAANNKVYPTANNQNNIQQSCIVTSSNAAANPASKEYRVPQAPIRTAFISSPNVVRVEKAFSPVGLKQVAAPQVQTKAQTKIYADIPNQIERPRTVEEVNHHQQQQQPNTPISFSIMDASRLNYVNTVANSVNKRPFQATYRHYQQPNTEVEFQRAKEYSNGNGPDCSVVVPRRPSPLQAHSQTSPLGHAPSPAYPLYNSPMNTAIPSPQNTSNHVTPPSPLDVTVPRPNSQNNVAYPSVITRTSNPNDNKMFPERYERPAQNQNWKFNNNYAVTNNIEVPSRQIESHQDLSSCRGDPMSIVKNLQQQQSCQMQPVEIKQEVKTIKRRKSSEKPVAINEIPGRIPPPAHCTTLNQQPQNGAYFDFERWNLPPPPTKIFNTQTMQQHQGLMVPHPHSHHVPSPIHYFAPFPLPPHPPEFQSTVELAPLTTYNEQQQPPAVQPPPQFPPPDDQPKVVVPNIEEELNFLSEATPPTVPRPPQIQQSKAINPPNVAKPADKPAGVGFMSSYIKFLQGERDSSPPPVVRATGRKNSWPKIKPINEIKSAESNGVVHVAPPPPPAQLKRLSQGDPQDDPRYFPLPKDRKDRFDSSDDGISSDDDLFNRKMPPLNKEHVKSGRKGRPCKPGGPTEKRRAKQAAKLKREKERAAKGAAQRVEVPVASEMVVTRRETSKRAAKEKVNLMLPRDEEVEEPQEFADSDSDPAWMPAAKEDGDDDVPLRKGGRRARPNTKRKGTRNLITAAAQGAGIQEQDGYNNDVLKTKKLRSPVKSQTINNVVPAVTNNTTVVPSVDISNNSCSIQEYPFKPGEFVVIKSELGQQSPAIWRVDGKTLLQKYEPFQQHGQTLYRNISTYTSWTPENKKQYIAVPVNIRSQTHTETIVEFKRELAVKDVAIIDRSVQENVKYHDNFEVYVQTLISQALDSNFLTEIFQEQDDYFLSNVQVIDSVAAGKKMELATALRWPTGIQSSISTWPCFNVIGDFANSDSQRWNCAACGLQAVASSRVLLYGQPYNNKTLEGCPVKTNNIHEKDFIMCRPCANSVQLFNKITHQKYLMYIECAKRVTEKRTMDSQKDTTCILNELLADEKWLHQLFLEVRKSWAEVDSVVHKHSEHKPVS